MATKKTTAKAAAEQPEANKPADKPEESVKAPEVQAPEATANEAAEPSTERGPATEGNLPNDDDQGAPEGGVVLEVVTRLERRIRAGVVVTQIPQTVTVSEEAAKLIEADPHISASRK